MSDTVKQDKRKSKIKTNMKYIIVEKTLSGDNYCIMWFDKGTNDFNIGYGSQNLDIVRQYMKDYFEDSDDAISLKQIKQGKWKYIRTVDHTDFSEDVCECSVCSGISHFLSSKFHPSPKTYSNFCKDCGAKMIDGDEK